MGRPMHQKKSDSRQTLEWELTVTTASKGKEHSPKPPCILVNPGMEERSKNALLEDTLDMWELEWTGTNLRGLLATKNVNDNGSLQPM